MGSIQRTLEYFHQNGLEALVVRVLEYTIVHWVALLISEIGNTVESDPNIVLLGASKGERYDDNSRYVYEYLLENTEMKPIWVTRNRTVLENLQEDGKPAVYTYSISGVRALFRASTGAFTNSLEDLAFHPSAVPQSMSLIALRHGIPLKRNRFARDDSSPRKHYRERKLTDCAISPSDFLSEIQESHLQIGRQNHVVTGLPRNDQIVNSEPSQHTELCSIIDGVDPESVLLYAPTWRHGRCPTEFFPFTDFDPDDLVEFLDRHNCLLLIRPHPKDLEWFEKDPDATEFSALRKLLEMDCPVKMASHREIPDTNTLLPAVDLMITDYSSIYHDFLLLDRPIIFVPYDFQEFSDHIGFLADYFENTPGPKTRTYEEFKNEIEKVVQGRDDHRKDRERLQDKTHRYVDDNSSKRVAEFIEKNSFGESL